ncbi:MAG: hypothetical protein JRF02_05840 [Deltaproteobacteria bacterium]|jgi:hypothetical protein|nr:hypothetical protein [Deltaproteobacteria bacterium]
MTARQEIVSVGLKKNPRVLFLYFSFSGQTGILVNRLSEGLKEQGVEVVFEKLRPARHLRFPVNGFLRTIAMMLTTFCRIRVPIKELSSKCDQVYNLIILAGPTWSYNPSGPILYFLDKYGSDVLGGQEVLPLISCRGYWKQHWWGLRRKLKKCGAHYSNLIAFTHPNPEPWCTIGVFLKIAGKNPERSNFIGKYYTRFGHSNDQTEEASRFGKLIGESLKGGTPLAEINFRTDLSLP